MAGLIRKHQAFSLLAVLVEILILFIVLNRLISGPQIVVLQGLI
ncbi:MAG: hypothetical protein PHX72_02945 [Candidatus Shapirobacteria bacterium]|nr:hypothetical protein [Candidatus Shapirobacteria bacterium]